MFKPGRHSLQIKFSFTAAIILLLIFTLASITRIVQNTNTQKESVLVRSETYAELATKPLGDAYNLYNNSGLLKLNDIFRQTLQLDQTIRRIQVVSVNGDILFDTQSLDTATGTSEDLNAKNIDEKLLQAVVTNELSRITDVNGDTTEIIVPYSDNFGSRPFSLRYFISYETIHASIRQAIWTTIILNIVLLLVTLSALAFLVHRSILSPLEKITEVALAIQNGDLSKNIAVHTNDELSELAISLNLMTTKLKNNIYALQKIDKLKDEFIIIASHNLRSPLTVIKGYLPTLKGKMPDENSEKTIEYINKSVKKLDSITELLLNIVSLEQTNQPLKEKNEDIIKIIRSIVESYTAIAAEKHITINLQLPEQEVFIPVDVSRIKQAFTNIIDNSVKFNKKNGHVVINLTALDNEIILSVSDTGIGITPEEVHDIFQRFHRGTDLLTYNYEGIGLGLYLSRIIVEAHHGRIWVTSKMDEGTNVYISLPRLKRDQQSVVIS